MEALANKTKKNRDEEDQKIAEAKGGESRENKDVFNSTEYCRGNIKWRL